MKNEMPLSTEDAVCTASMIQIEELVVFLVDNPFVIPDKYIADIDA
jgi:hypothetical protein